MHKCKECLHNSVCVMLFTENCEFFKDSSVFVELPCRVGDVVYCIDVIDYETVILGMVEYFSALDGSGNGSMEIRMPKEVPDIVSITCDWKQIGKTVFLTREEAEKAIADKTKRGE